MDTKYLKEFVVLAEKCNYADASDTLFLSQSSLFKHMKSIEHELDIVLFHKNGNRISLSEEGELFLKYAHASIEHETAFKNAIARDREKRKTIINVGFEYRIVDLLIAFRMQNSQYVVRQIDPVPRNKGVVNMLRSGKCELAFLQNFQDTADEFVQIPILEDQDVVVLYNSHPLANRKSISFQDIKDENFISLGDQDNTTLNSVVPGDLIGARFLSNNCSPRIVFNGIRGSELIDYVRKEMGITILFKKTLYSMDLSNISVVDIEPAYKITVSLCYPKNARLSAGAKSLVNFCSHAVQTGQIENILRNKA
ncbi:MAG: LysR family transcriptional regulator [Lachnospiraceae bacterium]|nr:LysR family transcriptional regulator [Lachnospiraceae bacterium]